MSRPYSKYHQVYRLTTLQRGRPTGLELSPTARWLCSTTDNGDFVVLRSAYGRIYFHIEMGRQNFITAIVWATDWQIILGCFNGAIYTATLTENPSPVENRVALRNLLHDEDSPVRALAWDPNRKRLAVGYAKHVSVWQRIHDKRPRVWEVLDEFCAPSVDFNASGQVLSLWFSRTGTLVAELETGTIVWSSNGTTTATDASIEERRIGAASLSSDHSILAASTRDQSVIIWPFLPNGPIVGLANTYSLESGREWCNFESRTPVAVTRDRNIVCGTLDGTIVVVDYRGSRLQRIENGALCHALPELDPR
ncbi:hypothetical protein FRC12_025209 [Ceratobasidium sp. 428]|nr:hypothetical protein FRC12_025209 [Ceratobasidium sp. 428]